MSEVVVFLGNLTTAPYAIHVAQAKSLGFAVNTKLTKSTNYVVCSKNAGAKEVKARELGLTILNEEEWEGIILEREKKGKNRRNTKTVNSATNLSEPQGAIRINKSVNAAANVTETF